ncbi:MAG: RpiB/LacA/LacB family sugar-phosphate isomerase [Candidatus Latescibacteria bacterium]|nr:RpiB/LacA/LacB family sugar-phosphate isomerase [Candidatus Latescibacterota bacterium]
MNHDELVEAIITEVKRVLNQRGIPVSSSAETSGSQAPAQQSPVPAQVSIRPTLPVEAPAAGNADMSGKQVITQKDLEAVKGQTVTITKKAVITPLALDFAKEKKITINRIDGAAGNKSGNVSSIQGTISVALVIAPDFKGDGSILKNILAAKHLTIKEITGGSYEANVKKLADMVVSGGAHFGVCLENTGMEAPIHANRNSAVRAVHCRDTYDARAARIDIGANVIVLGSISNPEAIISGFTGI